jgi:hypothetical protein
MHANGVSAKSSWPRLRSHGNSKSPGNNGLEPTTALYQPLARKARSACLMHVNPARNRANPRQDPHVCLTFVPKTKKENYDLLAHPRQFLTGLLFHVGSGGHGERLVQTLVLRLFIGYSPDIPQQALLEKGTQGGGTVDMNEANCISSLDAVVKSCRNHALSALNTSGDIMF